MKRGYDVIAGFYDNLARLVFGNALREAQTWFLSAIPAGATILVAGGGTGWILEELTRIRTEGLQIDYIDVSAKMIALSKKRNVGGNKVTFLHQSIFDFKSNRQYDAILTPFFFDNFKELTMQNAFQLLHQQLKPNAIWLYTDFQISRQHAYWQKAVLFAMYSFFRIAANIEATKLPNVVSCFQRYRYSLVENKTFVRQFITTSLYKKAMG